MRWKSLVIALALLPWAAWATNINPWDTGFDSGRPSNSTRADQVDDEILDVKQSVRARGDVEHAFSSSNVADTGNSGRHLVGSSRIFVVNGDTACSTITALVAADNNSSATLDQGRMCYDIADGEMCVWETVGTPSWSCTYPTPSGAILMTAAATCPNGFTDVSSTYTKLTVRVIDMAGTDADVPDTAGTKCTANGGECGAATTQYSDTLTENEIPSHTHDIESTASASGGSIVFAGRAADGGSTTSDSVGGDDPHYHPFVALRFCQRN